MAGAATTNNENGNSQVGLSLETQQWITMLGFVSLNPTYKFTVKQPIFG